VLAAEKSELEHKLAGAAKGGADGAAAGGERKPTAGGER
jgi:hypothetical protein